MIQFLFKKIQVSPKFLSAELPDSRGICAVGEPKCAIEK